MDGYSHTQDVLHPGAWSPITLRCLASAHGQTGRNLCRKCQEFDTNMPRFAEYNKKERILAENVGMEGVSSSFIRTGFERIFETFTFHEGHHKQQ